MLSDAFEEFVDSLQLENEEDIDTKFRSITKRLNTSYYGTNSEEDNSHKVGSIGRFTAINGVSDMDMLFVLPDSIYSDYNYEGNGQKELLKAVKAEIIKRYPNTDVRGDGQVVVISFTNYEVEVCPAFLKNDGSFTYPDSNNGGKWKKTNPIPEIDESIDVNVETNGHFKYVCQMLRAWKNHVGFKMGGLLIDTLVNNFFKKYPIYKNATFEDYLTLFKDLFLYLKGLDKEQAYWFALGSNQKVYNKGGAFVSKANTAYESLKDLDEDSEELYEVLQGIFGKKFPVPTTIEKSAQARFVQESYSITENFIEDLFPVDIRFRLTIDCKVKQDGFRDILLRTMVKQNVPLRINKKLLFFIADNEAEDRRLDYQIYWKVRNRGAEAVRRNQLRGEITRGSYEKEEKTSFKGGHYVECYIVHNGVCVAKDSINVPIDLTHYEFGVRR